MDEWNDYPRWCVWVAWGHHRHHHHDSWHYGTLATCQIANDTLHTYLTIIISTLQRKKVSLRKLKWLSKSLRLASVARSRKFEDLWPKHIETYFSCIRILHADGFWVCLSLLTALALSYACIMDTIRRLDSPGLHICVQERKRAGDGMISFSVPFIRKTKTFLETSSRLQPTFPWSDL